MYYNRDLRQNKTSYGDLMLESLRNIDRSDSRLNNPENSISDIPLVETVKASEKELLLGCMDEDFNTPVTIPYNGKSFSMLIVAGKGDGKTQWLKFFAFSQLHMRFGYNLCFIDPKNDYHNLHRPIKESALEQRLLKHAIEPRGFIAKYYKPAYFNMSDRKGDEYIVTLRDFDALEYGNREGAIKEFFNIEERTPAGKALGWILSKRIPKTIKGLKDSLKDFRKFEIKTREDAGSKNKSVSVAFDIALEHKIRQGLIGDDGQKLIIEVDDQGKPIKTKTVYAAHFPEDIQKYRVMVIQADLSQEKSYISSCYFKLVLASMWQNRKDYIDSHGERGVMANPTFMITDEADVLCPSEKVRNSPSRDQLNELGRRGRQYGWGRIDITQQPQQISKESIMHADYIVTTRLRNPKLKEIIQQKYGIEKYQIEELEKLEYDTNKPYKKWVLFTGNPSNPYVTFYPLPPQIEIITENQ